MNRYFDLRVVAATMLFVLLWARGAIVARLSLVDASAFAVLTVRFAVALLILVLLSLSRKRPLLPARDTRVRVMLTGALLIASYSIWYLLALAHDMTPGALATVCGLQHEHVLSRPTRDRSDGLRAAGQRFCHRARSSDWA